MKTKQNKIQTSKQTNKPKTTTKKDIVGECLKMLKYSAREKPFQINCQDHVKGGASESK